MKTYLIAIVMAIGTLGLTQSCTNETAEDDQLYIESPDHSDEPIRD